MFTTADAILLIKPPSEEILGFFFPFKEAHFLPLWLSRFYIIACLLQACCAPRGLLELCKQRGWLKAGGKQRTDSTHVLARARSPSVTRECVGETLRAALNEIVSQAPDWLASQVSLQWVQRYGHRVENYRLPKADTQRTALAEQIGADGLHRLASLGAA